MDNRVFHKYTLKDQIFLGIISGDGPYIQCEQTFEGVAIGTCTSFEKYDDPYGDDTDYVMFYVCKYRNQRRFALPGLLEKDILILSKEFGIPFGYKNKDANKLFRESAAFVHIVTWSTKHPKLYTRFKHLQNYLLWADMIDEYRAEIGKKIIETQILE